MYHLLVLVVGLLALAAVAVPLVLRERLISYPIVVVTVGVLVALLLPEVDFDPVVHGGLAEHLSEFAVIVALTGRGLSLDRRVSWRGWMSTWRLLAITMPLSILAAGGARLAGGRARTGGGDAVRCVARAHGPGPGRRRADRSTDHGRPRRRRTRRGPLRPDLGVLAQRRPRVPVHQPRGAGRRGRVGAGGVARRLVPRRRALQDRRGPGAGLAGGPAAGVGGGTPGRRGGVCGDAARR